MSDKAGAMASLARQVAERIQDDALTPVKLSAEHAAALLDALADCEQSERIAALEAALEQARVALESYAGYIQPLTNVFGGPEVPAEGSTSALVNAALRKIEEVQR